MQKTTVWFCYIIHSYIYFTYYKQVSENAYYANLNKLQVLQNQAIHIITGFSPIGNTYFMYKRAVLQMVTGWISP